MSELLKIGLGGLLSFAGALLAVVVGHWLTSQRKRRDELYELRLKAYTDFITAASHLAAARRTGETDTELAQLAALNDAKTRICICAEPDIVLALAEFWDHGGTLEREPEILAFQRLCLRIRESLGNDRHDLFKTEGLEVSNLLFKLVPSSYAFNKKKAP